MLAWEDGFCNFFASTAESNPQASSSLADKNCDIQLNGLRPEVFFKMSHEIHNYGEGLIGKVAADHGHKCIYSEQINLSVCQKSVDLHPRTWKAQFQSGIKTIALVAVDDGVLQLGAVTKVPEDLIYVAEVQKKFNNLQIIPGFLLPRPSSSPIQSSFSFPFTTPPIFIRNSFKIKEFNDSINAADDKYSQLNCHPLYNTTPLTSNMDISYHLNNDPPVMSSLLSKSSLEKLLLKLPSVTPASSSPPLFHLHDESPPNWLSSSQKPLMGIEDVAANNHQINEEKEHGMYLADIERVCPQLK